MGIYIITGGTKGMGGAAAEILRKEGHTVYNIDYDRGDLCVDLGTAEGRREAIESVHRLFPDGIDGLASNAGIASSEPLSKTIRVNYFGSVAIMEGLFDLLRMKKGRCMITVSNSVSYAVRNHLYVDRLLSDCGEEDRICRLVDTFDPEEVDNAIYTATKIALVRWMRRTAPWWAKHGVTLNAVAPGGVNTTIMDGVKNMRPSPAMMRALASPMLDDENRVLYAQEVAPAFVHMLLPDGCAGVGNVFYCDGGTECLLHTDKYY